MDADDDQLRDLIVKHLENSFVFRQPIDPHVVASDLAKRVDLPVEELAAKVTMVAKGLGVGIKPTRT
jgi:hypothetical protein